MDWWSIRCSLLGKDSHQSVYTCIYIILRPCSNQYISCCLNRDYNRVPNCILFLVWSRWLAFVLYRRKRLVLASTLWLGHTLSSHSLVPTGRHAPGFCLRVLVLLHVGPVLFAGTRSVLLVPGQQSFFLLAELHAGQYRSLWGCDSPIVAFVIYPRVPTSQNMMR